MVTSSISATYNVFVFLRALYQDPTNLTPTVALVEQSKIYLLNGKDTAKPMKFPDASGVPANMLPLSDGSAFEQLKLLVDSEGVNLADSDWLGMLAAVGIVRGQPFNPDAHTRGILDRAAKTAYKMSEPLPRPQSTDWQSSQLARDRAGQGVFRDPPALRTHRGSAEPELEARRHREAELNATLPTENEIPPSKE
jgi:hypothetical protein